MYRLFLTVLIISLRLLPLKSQKLNELRCNNLNRKLVNNIVFNLFNQENLIKTSSDIFRLDSQHVPAISALWCNFRLIT